MHGKILRWLSVVKIWTGSGLIFALIVTAKVNHVYPQTQTMSFTHGSHNENQFNDVDALKDIVEQKRLYSLKVAELKSILQFLKTQDSTISLTGKKEDLVARIEAAILPQQTQIIAPPTPQQNINIQNEPNPETINLIVDYEGTALYFKIKKTTPLLRLMEAFCKRHGVSFHQMTFAFDGSRVTGVETAEELEMEDMDCILAFSQEVGGMFHFTSARKDFDFIENEKDLNWKNQFRINKMRRNDLVKMLLAEKLNV